MHIFLISCVSTLVPVDITCSPVIGTFALFFGWMMKPRAPELGNSGVYVYALHPPALPLHCHRTPRCVCPRPAQELDRRASRAPASAYIRVLLVQEGAPVVYARIRHLGLLRFPGGPSVRPPSRLPSRPCAAFGQPSGGRGVAPWRRLWPPTRSCGWRCSARRRRQRSAPRKRATEGGGRSCRDAAVSACMRRCSRVLALRR